jgi:hypothetical protein
MSTSLAWRVMLMMTVSIDSGLSSVSTAATALKVSTTSCVAGVYEGCTGTSGLGSASMRESNSTRAFSSSAPNDSQTPATWSTSATALK